MYERSSTALGTAALFTILVAACNDSPLAPRDKGLPPTASMPPQSGVRVFEGRVADSLVHVFDAVWARDSHVDYRPTRRAWRIANGVPESVGDPGFSLVPFTPNATLTDGDDGSLRPPPQILSHYEAFHFGHRDQYTNVPDGIETEVTFIGDQAEISATSVAVTKTGGSTYSWSGSVAKGAGELISCTDIAFGSCDNRRRLNGLTILNDAATCGATASGTLSYYVSNVTTPLSLTLGTVGSSTTGVAVTGNVSGTASACSEGDDGGGQQNTDSTSTAPSGPVGVPSAPPPPPSGPYVPSYPPTSGGTTSTYFHCEEGYTYENGTLFETTITCYPS